MTSKSILDVEVSCFKNYDTCYNPKTINLLQWLKSTKYAKQVDVIRSISDKDERDIEKAKLPAITPGGLYSYRATKYLIKFSGLMQLDIDLTHNPHIRNFNELKELVSILDYVAYCGTSVSGLGYWLLIPIQESEKYKDHFEALAQDWKEIARIVIDPNRKDIAGLRGYSYDPEAYYNHKAQYYTKTIVNKSKSTSINKNRLILASTDVFNHVQQIVEGYGLSFVDGYRHNYLVKLCQYLNRFGVTRDDAESWIFENLPITPQEIKSNCISQPYDQGRSEFGKYQTVLVPFDLIEDYNENSYRIRQKQSFFYIPKSNIEITEQGCYTQKYIVENPKSKLTPIFSIVDFRLIDNNKSNTHSTVSPSPSSIMHKMPMMQPNIPEKGETKKLNPIMKQQPLGLSDNQWMESARKTNEKPVRPATGKLKILEDRWVKDKAKHKKISDVFQSMKIASILDQFKREKPSDQALAELEKMMFGNNDKPTTPYSK